MVDIQLKKILKLKRLSQLDLAELLGLSRQTVIALLQGGDTKISTLRILSQKLNVPISYWFEDEIPAVVKSIEDSIQKNADVLFLQEQLIVEKQKVLEYQGMLERLHNDLAICRLELQNLKAKCFDDAGQIAEIESNPTKIM